MNSKRLIGRRVQIAGSASPTCSEDRLQYCQNIVSSISNTLAESGCGFVVTVGSEPVHPGAKSLPSIFDWTVLESSVDVLLREKKWPMSQGNPIVAVGLPKWLDKIPPKRIGLWNKMTSAGIVELVQVPAGVGVGGVLRHLQSRYGDILIALGGGPGTEHLAGLYYEISKSVVPVDLPIGHPNAAPRGGERLFLSAIQDPTNFFQLDRQETATASLASLSLRHLRPNAEKFSADFCGFLSSIRAPTAFLVRLLNKDSEDFLDVERFFRAVVEPVIRLSGYSSFESGTNASPEPLLNVEIFRMIHSSGLVVIDLTGIRPNCLMELGYALGIQKKYVLTAKKGTRLPFDAYALPCHFWSPEVDLVTAQSELKSFMNVNGIRKPITKESRLIL